jgi:hypothetical protein
MTEVREDLKGKNFSFTEIAKTTGERWQVLPAEEKALHESKSTAMKDKYLVQLVEYKKTRQYAEYQEYLVDFRAKHANPSSRKPKVLVADVTKPTSRPDSKRKRDDQQNGSSCHSSCWWNESRPDVNDATTQSSERQYGDQYRAVFEPHLKLARVDWSTSIVRDDNLSEYLPSIHLDTPALPSSYKKSVFTSIDAPRLRDPRSVSKYLWNGDHHAAPSYTKCDHLIGTSIKLAYYGSTSGLNDKPTTTISDTSRQRQQVYMGPIASPTFWRPDSTAFSNGAKSTDAASTPNVLSLSTSKFLNSHLLPCIPSRLANPYLGATALEFSALPKRSLFAPLPSSLASLLRGGEHLASQE